MDEILQINKKNWINNSKLKNKRGNIMNKNIILKNKNINKKLFSTFKKHGGEIKFGNKLKELTSLKKVAQNKIIPDIKSRIPKIKLGMPDIKSIIPTKIPKIKLGIPNLISKIPKIPKIPKIELGMLSKGITSRKKVNNTLNNKRRLQLFKTKNTPENAPISKDSGIFKSFINSTKDKFFKKKDTINNTPENKGFFQKIKDFFKTDFYFFFKNYLYFIVLFSICFYLLLYVNNTSRNKTEIIITKIFFYLVIVFLFVIINDILETPLEYQKKFIMLIIFSLITTYIVGHIVEYFYGKHPFYSKLLIVFISSIVVFIISIITIYLTFFKGNKNATNKLFLNFSGAIRKNIYFLIFTFIIIFLYNTLYRFFHAWNSNLSDILSASLLGLLFIFFSFNLIVYLAYKMEIINKMQILNTYISLFSISVFLCFLYAHLFLTSIDSICKTNEKIDSMYKEEIMTILLLISIIIILWYEDERNWHNYGSILFLLATVFGLYCMFYYSLLHPNLSLLSFWFFIEWLIILFYRKENSKNSIHFSFMNV